jgi:hypothetical protein
VSTRSVRVRPATRALAQIPRATRSQLRKSVAFSPRSLGESNQRTPASTQSHDFGITLGHGRCGISPPKTPLNLSRKTRRFVRQPRWYRDGGHEGFWTPNWTPSPQNQSFRRAVGPLRQSPISREKMLWRGPESNRRHHDFQSWIAVRAPGAGGGARERCPCKSSSSGHRTCFDRPHPHATSRTPGGRRRLPP